MIYFPSVSFDLEELARVPEDGRIVPGTPIQPVSINNNEITGLIGMMGGPMMMGLYFSYLTNKTKTLWWAIVANTIGGLIMVL